MESLEIQTKLDRLMRAYIFSVAGGAIVGNPFIAADALKLMGMKEHGTMEARGTNGRVFIAKLSDYLLSFDRPATNLLSGTPMTDFGHNLEMIQGWAKIMVLELGDWLKKSGPESSDPLFEFVRHVRNAIAHGGYFDIWNVKNPAKFDELEITTELHGTYLWDYMMPGDVFLLVVAAIERLRSIEGPA